jgi:hypothetical protein
MVTATNGTLTFVGASGKVYSIDLYISDVVAAYCTLNPTGKAGTGNNTFWPAPENVTLVDASIATGPTVMVGLLALRDDAPVNGGAIRIANFLNTLTTRKISIGWQKGQNIAFTQF